MRKQDAEKAQEAARASAEEAVQAWLEQTLPGAELISAEPYVFHHLGVAPYRLTDLVSGTFYYDDREQSYWLNTSNGEAWLETDRVTADALCALCCATVMEALRFSNDLDSYEVTEGYAYLDIGTAEQIDVLPVEFVLSGEILEHLVRDSTNRLPLIVMFSCTVPDDELLSGITFRDVLRIQEECGLQLFNVQFTNQWESVLLSYDHMTYRRLSEGGEAVVIREERLDENTGRLS